MSKKIYFTILLIVSITLQASKQTSRQSSLSINLMRYVNILLLNHTSALPAHQPTIFPESRSSSAGATQYRTALIALNAAADEAKKEFEISRKNRGKSTPGEDSFLNFAQFLQRLTQIPLSQLRNEVDTLNRAWSNIDGKIKQNSGAIDRINKNNATIQATLDKSNSSYCQDPMSFINALNAEDQLEYCRAHLQNDKLQALVKEAEYKLFEASKILNQRQEQLTQLGQLNKSFTNVARTHNLSTDDKRLVEAINQAIKEDAALHQLKLTPEIKTLLAQGNIKVQNLENSMVNTFQKYLIERGIKVSIDQAALLKEHSSDPKITRYVQATITTNTAALDLATTGTAQEALAAAKITSVLEQATNIEIGLAKGLAYGTAGIAITSFAIAAVPEIGGALLLKLGYDTISFLNECIATKDQNIAIAIDKFNALPLDQKAEQIGFYGSALFAPLVGKLAGNIKFKEAMNSLIDIAKTEYTALKSYLTLDKAFLAEYKGISFPQQHIKTMTELIDSGKIATQAQAHEYIKTISGPITHCIEKVGQEYAQQLKNAELAGAKATNTQAPQPTTQKTMKESATNSGSSSSSSSAAAGNAGTQSTAHGEVQAATQEIVYATTPEGFVIEVRAAQDTETLHMGAQGPNNNNSRSGSSSSNSSSGGSQGSGVKVGTENATVAGQKGVQWTRHGNRHVPPKNIPWKEIIKQTKTGDAKYKPDINIEALERKCWGKGVLTADGKSHKIFDCGEIIGAYKGEETPYVLIKWSANEIHGHPISYDRYKSLINKDQIR